MKKIFLACLAVFSLLFSQCSPDKDTELSPKFDYTKATVQLMDKLVPQVVGSWKLQQVHIKFQDYDYNQKKHQLTKDTVFQDFATLDIERAATPVFSPEDPRYPAFDGTLHFQGKTYPVHFYLLANPEQLVKSKGPQAFFLFEYNFPTGMHITEPEEAFLNDLGILGENYSLEMVAGQPTMFWRGLNRGVNKIEFRKQ